MAFYSFQSCFKFVVTREYGLHFEHFRYFGTSRAARSHNRIFNFVDCWDKVRTNCDLLLRQLDRSEWQATQYIWSRLSTALASAFATHPFKSSSVSFFLAHATACPFTLCSVESVKLYTVNPTDGDILTIYHLSSNSTHQVMSGGTHELKGKSVEVKTAAPRDGPRPFNGGGGGYNGGGGGYGGGYGGGGGGGYGGQQGWSQQVCLRQSRVHGC